MDNLNNFYRTYFEKTRDDVRIIDRERLVKEHLEGKTVLDLGCGQGKMAIILEGKNLYGVDIVKTATERAKKRGYKNALVVDLNREKLPFKQEFFDSAFSLEVMEHLFDPLAVLSDLNRVLKPKGRLLISVPNVVWFLNRIFFLFGIFTDSHSVHLVSSHVRFFTIKRFSCLLKETGFRVEKVIGTTDFITPIPGTSFLNFIARIYPSLFAYNLFFVCRKKKGLKEKKYSYQGSKGFYQAIRNILKYR